MANVKRGAAVVEADVVARRGKTVRAGSIAVGVVQGVVAKEGKLRAHSNAAVDDQLVLLEDAFGLVLVDGVSVAQRMWRCRGIARQGRANRRVDVFGEKLVDAAGRQIGDREIGDLRELALEGHAGLHGVRRAEIQIWPIKGRGNVAHLLESRRSRRIVQIKLRVGDDELLLRDIVQTLLLQHKVVPKTVVKDAKARAKNGLGRLFSASINAPSQAETRRKIGVVPTVVLTFVSQSVTH